MEQARKKFKMDTQKTIVTHNGTFHCDESLACFMLRQTNSFRSSQIIRTRDPAVIDQGDIVVDVGAVYDAERLVVVIMEMNFSDCLFGGCY